MRDTLTGTAVADQGNCPGPRFPPRADDKKAPMATPARRIAAEVLMRVAQGGAFANLALDAALRQAGVLEPREVALATELTYGTLRWQLQLERALDAFGDKSVANLDAPVRVVLRLGAFELLHHPRVPARAAVNEAVELVKELKL